jgi:lysine/ornithine N-monooxygenase
MTGGTNVAIIGAGPYGLSIATHLRAHGTSFRIFGSPLHRWREQMPEGMFLKSEGFASNLYEPAGLFTLKQFCADQGLAYADIGAPVARSTFGAYGMAFQRRMVPDLEDRLVAEVGKTRDGFNLRLVDGKMVSARRVVVATGLTYFDHIPDTLGMLPRTLVSHSTDHGDLLPFRDMDITVVGGGSSALDLAVALQDVGAQVRLVARRPAIVFNPYVAPKRSLWSQVRYPVSGIGFGLRGRLYTNAPMAFYYLPEAMRLRVVKTYLGPSGGHYLRDRVFGKVPLMLGCTPVHAEASGRGVRLSILHADGRAQDLVTDHVVSATGYRVDLRRMAFIGKDLRMQIRSVEHSPILSKNFESSVKGLHFVGLASANSFGPVMRFMVGAAYTARRLANYLAVHEDRAVSRP